MNLKTSKEKTKIVAASTSTIVDINVKNSSIVAKGQIIVTVESMKMQSHIVASAAGGSFKIPRYTASWPTGEIGAMGIEGAVKLGFKKELESVEDGLPRDNLFADLVEKMYDRGRSTEAASFLEIDTVIDPSESRFIIARALHN